MRILFVAGRYYPTASANGVCVMRVQDALLRRGIQSDVIAETEESLRQENEYGVIYGAPMVNFRKKSKLQRLVGALRYPLYYPEDIDSFRAAIEKAMSEHTYDAIVSVLKPAPGGVAALDYSNVMIYEFDSITNNVDHQSGYRKLLSYRTYRWEKRMYQNAVRVFHMLSHQKFYSQERYKPFAAKSEFVDIPQLMDEKLEDRAGEHKNEVKILYSGILHQGMRSPEYAIDLVKVILPRISYKLEMNFYSRGSCEQMIEDAQRATNNAVRQNGYVPLHVLNKAVEETDFLLSIGNKLTGTVTSLPSKVISYMAYGKPILHIDSGSNDVATDYLKRYPLALIIDPAAGLEENAAKLVDFISRTQHERVTFDAVKKLFPMNTPEYFADRMLQVIEADCKKKVSKKS